MLIACLRLSALAAILCSGKAFSQINLLSVTLFALLATSAITNTEPSTIDGLVGISPNTASSITGFGYDSSTGEIHANDAATQNAIRDTRAASVTAAGLSTTSQIVGDLGGQTLAPGVYEASSTAGITGVLTLDGQDRPDSLFVFKIGSSLTTATASSVVLIRGAQACNVYWQVGSSATLGTASTFAGTILAGASISLERGTTVAGGLYALNGAVALMGNRVTAQPACGGYGPLRASASSSSAISSSIVSSRAISSVPVVTPPSSVPGTISIATSPTTSLPYIVTILSSTTLMISFSTSNILTVLSTPSTNTLITPMPPADDCTSTFSAMTTSCALGGIANLPSPPASNEDYYPTTPNTPFSSFPGFPGFSQPLTAPSATPTNASASSANSTSFASYASLYTLISDMTAPAFSPGLTTISGTIYTTISGTIFSCAETTNVPLVTKSTIAMSGSVCDCTCVPHVPVSTSNSSAPTPLTGGATGSVTRLSSFRVVVGMAAAMLMFG